MSGIFTYIWLIFMVHVTCRSIYHTWMLWVLVSMGQITGNLLSPFGPLNRSLRHFKTFTFSTKYAIPKSLKVGHWPSETVYLYLQFPLPMKTDNHAWIGKYTMTMDKVWGASYNYLYTWCFCHPLKNICKSNMAFPLFAR